MTGYVCLQGGNEFRPECRETDRAWLGRVAPGVVAVTPLACAAGVEYRTAGRNGAAYLSELGVADVVVPPEPGVSLRTSVRAIIDADIVVIPGGSPARIFERVVETAVGGALRAHVAGGGTVVGASAGAMVLCDLMLLPGEDMQVRPGLGLVPGVLVLPHYDEPRAAIVERVADQVADDVTIVGIPSCCGVLYGDDGPGALGPRDSWQFTPGAEPAAIPRA